MTGVAEAKDLTPEEAAKRLREIAKEPGARSLTRRKWVLLAVALVAAAAIPLGIIQPWDSPPYPCGSYEELEAAVREAKEERGMYVSYRCPNLGD